MLKQKWCMTMWRINDTSVLYRVIQKRPSSCTELNKLWCYWTCNSWQFNVSKWHPLAVWTVNVRNHSCCGKNQLRKISKICFFFLCKWCWMYRDHVLNMRWTHESCWALLVLEYQKHFFMCVVDIRNYCVFFRCSYPETFAHPVYYLLMFWIHVTMVCWDHSMQQTGTNSVGLV